jgi:hypothetical protein
MQVRSLKSLVDLVEQAEEVEQRLESLNAAPGGAKLPDFPAPIKFEAVLTWLQEAEECLRRPRVAESKRLLAERGIESTGLAANVLGEPESLREIAEMLDLMADGLRPNATAALARALTIGIDEGRAAVGEYKSAAEALESLHLDQPARDWLHKLTIKELAVSPADSKNIVEKLSGTCEFLDAVEAYGVVTCPYNSLEDAAEEANEFLKVAREYGSLISGEGLEADLRAAVDGKNTSKAIDVARRAASGVLSEKSILQAEVFALREHLFRLGGDSPVAADTLAELRNQRARLTEEIGVRQRSLLSSFGSEVSEVVQALLEGRLPSTEGTTDEVLGHAIRTAIESGCRFRLELPHED